LTVVQVLELRRWDAAEVVEDAAVVEPVDPFEGGEFEVSPFRIHDLRHTAVALWIAAGASPNEIARRAGHSSVVTVLDRYGHLLPGTEERVTDALDALHEEALAATGTTGVVIPILRAN
jgi:integrase